MRLFFLLLWSVSSVFAESIEVRVLSPFNPADKPEIENAQELLYEVLVGDRGVLPPHDPSGLRVERPEKRKPRLVNRFDSVGMRFNAYQDGQLVATARLSGTVDGQYERELYDDLPAAILPTRERAPTAVWEVNRVARKPSADKSVEEALWNEIKRVCKLNGWSYFSDSHDSVFLTPAKPRGHGFSAGIAERMYHPDTPCAWKRLKPSRAYAN